MDPRGPSGKDREETLQWAARANSPGMARMLLAEGRAVDERGACGLTALGVACELGHWNVAEVLLGAGADMMAPMPAGGSCVDALASSGQPLFHCILAQRGVADFEAGGAKLPRWLDGPIFELALRESLSKPLELTQAMLAAFKPSESCDAFDALSKAMRRRPLGILPEKMRWFAKAALAKPGWDWASWRDGADWSNHGPSHGCGIGLLSAIYGWEDVFEEASAQGMDIHALDPVGRKSLLGQAIARRSLRGVKFLIERGADPRTVACQGYDGEESDAMALAKACNFSEAFEVVQAELLRLQALDVAKEIAEAIGQPGQSQEDPQEPRRTRRL